MYALCLRRLKSAIGFICVLSWSSLIVALNCLLGVFFSILFEFLPFLIKGMCQMYCDDSHLCSYFVPDIYLH